MTFPPPSLRNTFACCGSVGTSPSVLPKCVAYTPLENSPNPTGAPASQVAVGVLAFAASARPSFLRMIVNVNFKPGTTIQPIRFRMIQSIFSSRLMISQDPFCKAVPTWTWDNLQHSIQAPHLVARRAFSIRQS